MQTLPQDIYRHIPISQCISHEIDDLSSEAFYAEHKDDRISSRDASDRFVTVDVDIDVGYGLGSYNMDICCYSRRPFSNEYQSTYHQYTRIPKDNKVKIMFDLESGSGHHDPYQTGTSTFAIEDGCPGSVYCALSKRGSLLRYNPDYAKSAARDKFEELMNWAPDDIARAMIVYITAEELGRRDSPRDLFYKDISCLESEIDENIATRIGPHKVKLAELEVFIRDTFSQ